MKPNGAGSGSPRQERRIGIGDYELIYQHAFGAPTLAPAAGLEQTLDFRRHRSAAPAQAGENKRCALHLHGFYVPELLHLVDELLGRIDHFDLFITTDSNAKKSAIESGLRQRLPESLDCRWQVLSRPNQGRNVGALLIDVYPLLGDYDCVLHMHSKRSVHLKLAEVWRRSLCDNLIGSAKLIADIRQAFADQPQLGLLIPQTCEAMRHCLHWGDNFSIAQLLWDPWQPDRPLRIDAPLVFPAGMMFWFRPAALQGLQQTCQRILPLPAEPLALDGTPLHALERLVAHACEAEGYQWRFICGPSGEPSTSPWAADGHSEPSAANLSVISTELTSTYLEATSLLAARARKLEHDLELVRHELQLVRQSIAVPRWKRIGKQLLRRSLKPSTSAAGNGPANPG